MSKWGLAMHTAGWGFAFWNPNSTWDCAKTIPSFLVAKWCKRMCLCIAVLVEPWGVAMLDSAICSTCFVKLCFIQSGISAARTSCNICDASAIEMDGPCLISAKQPSKILSIVFFDSSSSVLQLRSVAKNCSASFTALTMAFLQQVWGEPSFSLSSEPTSCQCHK